MEPKPDRTISIPCQTISDGPSRFVWRVCTLMYAGISFRWMRSNSILICLPCISSIPSTGIWTDDQGWRIEIKQYPKLTEVGGWRNGTMVGQYSDQQYDSIRYGGYYTRRRSERWWIMLPKGISTSCRRSKCPDMPPLHWQLIRNSPVQEVRSKWLRAGVFSRISLSDRRDIHFPGNILDEVMAILPLLSFILAAMKPPKTAGKNVRIVRRSCSREGLASEEELQSYFVQRIEKYVNSKGAPS